MVPKNLHSKTVSWVKITLPLIGLALMSSIFLLSGTPDTDSALPYAEADIEQIVREQRVTEPRFAGLLGEGREIILTAETVSSNDSTTNRLEAHSINGHLDLNATESLTIDAAFGTFDMARQTATLSDHVMLRTSMGYVLQSDVMILALDAIDVRAPTSVQLTGPGIDITSDTMELSGPDGETILHFNGSVRVLYQPQS